MKNWASPYWNKFGNVRMDVRHIDPIYYHTNFQSWNASIFANPPDPKIKMEDDYEGSDVLNIIQNFLETDSPVCGSAVFVVLKRYPSSINLSEMISSLQKNHVFIYTFASTTALGPPNSELMYNLATKTNGLCSFADDYPLSWDIHLGAQIAHYAFQIYSTYQQVFGKGVVDLPSVYSPWSGYNFCLMEVTLQNHSPLDDFVSLNITMTTDNGDSTFVQINGTQTTFFYKFVNLQPNRTYEIRMGYDYNTDKEESVQIRMYKDDPFEYWMPFDN